MSVFRPGLFKGKVALVTGGATGIGRAITEELLSLGCKVMIASRKEDRLRAAQKEMDPKGDVLHTTVCNIRQEDQSLAVEWAQSGVRINSVAPGSSIYSPTAARNYSEDNIFERARAGIPTKRLGTTQEIASAVCFLLSPGAAFISGETLKVDGGGSLYSPLMWQISEHKNLPAYQWTYKPPEEEQENDSVTKAKL